MLSPLRALWRLARLAAHLLHGAAIVRWELENAGAAARQARVGWWSARLLRLLDIGVQTVGAPAPGAKLLVANHISWLDIIAIHAVCPQARFVSKAEVDRWPLLGRLITAGGTLYIRRERKRDALHVAHAMADALRAGDTVAIFPEGTTGDGHTLLPFHANLLQAAIAAGAPVQPVGLRYSDARESISPAVQYVGSTTLLQSAWAVARARGLCVHLNFAPLREVAGLNRRALSDALRADIEAARSA